MACENKPIITMKRGDSLALDMTVQDTNTDTAVAAAADVVTTKAAYDVVLAAAGDTTATLLAWNNAITAYDAAIIVDITGWTIDCQIAWSGKLVDTLTATITSATAGEFTISALPAMTQLWKTRLLEVMYNSPVQRVLYPLRHFTLM